MRSARFIALFALTFITFDAILAATLEVRGACDYVKVFHTWNMFLSSIVAVTAFELLYSFTRSLERRPWGIQWLVFSLVALLTLLLTLPFADWVAISYEKSQGQPMMNNDSYGDYYWDDSGMSDWPVSRGYIIFFFFWRPFHMLFFLGGSAAVMSLSKKA